MAVSDKRRSTIIATAGILTALVAVNTAAWFLVRGARVETWALGRVPTVYCYDFKSAYPSAYMSKPIGIGARHLAHGDDDGAPGSVWRCRWFWPWRDKIPPVLDQRTGAGAGWC